MEFNEKVRHGGFSKRGHLEIMYDILSFYNNGLPKRTHILHKCNLSSQQLQKYSELLNLPGLLKKRKVAGKEFYEVTEKGKEFLKAFQHLETLFRTSNKLNSNAREMKDDGVFELDP